MMNITIFLLIVIIACICALTAQLLVRRYANIDTVTRSRLDSIKNAKKQNKKLSAHVQDLARKLEAFMPAKANDIDKYRTALATAGLKIRPEDWHGFTMLVVVAFTFIGFVVSVVCIGSLVPVILGTLFGAFLGWWAPRFYVAISTKSRKTRLSSQLPSALELLAVTVRAGYPLEHSLRVIGDMLENDIGSEFRQVSVDINRVGMDLPQALRRMQDRCQNPEVTMFVSSMIQAYKQGTSISRILSSQARIARNEYYAKKLTEINQLSTKMAPVILFIFIPLIIVIMLVPTIVDVANSLMNTNLF